MTPTAFRATGSDGVSHAATLYKADERTRRNALFVFAHGAGAGQSSTFMTRYATALAERGIDVVTFDFLYMEARRSAPDRAPVLEDTFRRVIVGAQREADLPREGKLFIGGKSMGGRMATHVAAAREHWPAGAPLAGVIVFGYPLNPPGGPSKRSPDRVSHLFNITVPTLIVQGTRDNFGGPDDIRAAITDRAPAITVAAVEGGDHSLASRNKPAAARMEAEVWETVAAWVASH